MISNVPASLSFLHMDGAGQFHRVKRRMISVDNFFVFLRLLFFAFLLLGWGGGSWFVCCCLPVVVWFLFGGFPLPLGAWGWLRYFIVALPEPSINCCYM